MGKLSPIVSEFDNAEDEQAYQRWFHTKVNASLGDQRPTTSHANIMNELDEIIERAEGPAPPR